jgi:hypothetical protein
MSRRTVAVLEVVGIQSYVFASDVLREIIGASHLVRLATEVWPEKYLLKGEGERVIAAGGGRCRVLLNRSNPNEFFERYSREVIENAPGLPLTYGLAGFDWEAPGALKEALRKASAGAARERDAGPWLPTLSALPVSARCESTSEAASYWVDDPGGAKRYVSTATAAKRSYTDLANAHLEKTCAPACDSFPLDFDAWRSHGESSYVGVIHADGNRMGERIGRLLTGVESDNDAYMRALGDVSNSFASAGNAAITSIVAAVRQRVEGSRFADAFTLPGNEKGGCFLPIRPLVYGGDDVTIVCDGRIALSVAAWFLRALASKKLEAGTDQQEAIDASAGVAIVKSHYPFAHAYSLAVQLTESAKEKARAIGSALDWHLSAHNLGTDLQTIRQQEYTVPHGPLLARPLAVGNGTEWPSWEGLLKLRASFLTREWDQRRSRRRELLDVLRKGPESTERFVARYVPEGLPKIPGLDGEVLRCGWLDSGCAYHDALEMLDMLVPIEKEQHP